MALILDGDGSISGIDEGIAISGVTTITGDIHLTENMDHVGDEDTRIRFPANDTFSIDTAGSERLRVDSTGKVGIGETEPTAPLSVKGANTTFGADSTLLSLGADSFGDETHRGIGFGFVTPDTPQPPAYIGYQEKDPSTNTKGDLLFATRDVVSNTAPTERMRITAAGLVGIGTDNPGRKLTIQDASDTFLSIRGGTNASTPGILFGDLASDSIGQIRYYNDGDALAFETNGAERVRIGSAGSFAIGTAAINANFAVGGAPGGGTGALNVYCSNAGGWASQMRNDHANGNGLFIRGGGDAADEFPLYVTNNDETNHILVVSANQRVGIGSTIPRAALDVPGGGATRLLLAENTSLSGSTVDITGVPAWATKIVVNFYRMSASVDNEFGVRLGTTSGMIDTNYDSTSTNSTGGQSALSVNRFVILNQNASHAHSGIMTIEKVSDARYVATHQLAVRQDSGATRSGAGYLELVTETIDRLQIFLPSGNFDTGTVTVYVE